MQPPRTNSIKSIEVARSTSLVIDDGKVTVAERITEIGFGAYQCQIFILCAGFIVAEGSELQMASARMNAISVEFGLVSSFARSMLMTAVFLGLAVGTIASGPLGDSYGRRCPLFVGYAGVVLTAMLLFFAPNVAMIYLLNFVLGFFAGTGIPAALITLAEVTPTPLRGMSTAALGAAFSIGELWAAAGLMMYMPDLHAGPWRHLVLWAAFPAASLLVFGMLCRATRYDTPHFLAVNNRGAELVESMNLIATMNGRSDLHMEGAGQVRVEKSTSLSWAEALPRLTRSPLGPFVVVQCFLFFAKDFAFYGMGVFWPLAWAQVPGVGEIPPATELLCTSLLGLPGVGIAMGLMLFMPRRSALGACAGLCAFAAFALRGLLEGRSLGLAGVVVFKLCFPTWQMVTMLLPSELFPTQVKCWGYAVVAVFGRIATIVVPIVVEWSHDGFLVLTSMLAVASLSIIRLLPETKDCELVNLPEEKGHDCVEYGTMGAQKAP